MTNRKGYVWAGICLTFAAAIYYTGCDGGGGTTSQKSGQYECNLGSQFTIGMSDIESESNKEIELHIWVTGARRDIGAVDMELSCPTSTIELKDVRTEGGMNAIAVLNKDNGKIAFIDPDGIQNIGTEIIPVNGTFISVIADVKGDKGDTCNLDLSVDSVYTTDGQIVDEVCVEDAILIIK
jgi:hypothetical protein